MTRVAKVLLAALPVLASCTKPEEAIGQAVQKWLTERNAQLVLGGHTLVNLRETEALVEARVLIYSEGTHPEEMVTWLHLSLDDGSWKVTTDLVEHWNAKVREKTFQDPLMTRMRANIEKRFKRKLGPKMTAYRESATLDPVGKTLVGRIQMVTTMKNPRAPASPGTRLVYIETHRFEKEEWVFDGFSLHQNVPKRTPR